MLDDRLHLGRFRIFDGQCYRTGQIAGLVVVNGFLDPVHEIIVPLTSTLFRLLRIVILLIGFFAAIALQGGLVEELDCVGKVLKCLPLGKGLGELAPDLRI
ncbi:hypothetical protein DSCA_19560 [Desulfosarcina alkanivorans]|uniref:Uncharacterized protein n=1 Tax=Desulfosarcina alkanivorans TaxID=571177 RepID=A0A5K7YG33_9BACT|nr:hypothetical protein DSCA_19560 [Desulfosarcina alkanivorans]